MGSIKLSIHPAFYILGIYYAFTGRISLFVICSASAVLHELGHSFSALHRGYRLDKIVLMPFGAIAKGDIDGLKLKDEFAIAIIGPIVNLSIALLTIAFWWIYPEIYPFTEDIVVVNLSMGIVNLIPAYPLDGGRVLHAVLSKRHKNSLLMCRIIGLIFGVVLFGFFIASLFNKTNVSLLLFSIFIIFGSLLKEKENVYVRVNELIDVDKLKRGVEIKRYAFDYNASVKRVINSIDTDKLCEIVVYKDKEQYGLICVKSLLKVINSSGIYQKIGEFVDGEKT